MTNHAPNTNISSINDLWRSHNPRIITINENDQEPFKELFYPVYKLGSIASYSPMELIEQKGYLKLNKAFLRNHLSARRRMLQFYPGEDTIDTEITRIPNQIVGPPTIIDSDLFTREMARAMQADISAAESLNPNFSHFVLCGGKDSLNLLLLKWKNPPIALSAHPNFPLVRRFVSDNGLPNVVVELRNDLGSPSRSLVESNCCLNDLRHCRWTQMLSELANDSKHNAIFWKGQLGDVVLTNKWMKYTNYRRGNVKPGDVLDLEPKDSRDTVSPTSALNAIRCALWDRGALWQGAHMSLLRRATGCLFLSGYHGSNVLDVISRSDLTKTSKVDVRDQIGEILFGATPVYPLTNPSPEIYKHYLDAWRPKSLIQSLLRKGIRVTF